MKHIYLLCALFVCNNIKAQNCSLSASAPVDTITCGQSVFLSAYGQGLGTLLMAENFNNGTYGAGWSSTTQAMWNNPCSPAGVDGTTHVWMGNSSPVPRILNTAVFDLSNCAQAGVTFCFDMVFATQGNAAPCEGPDEPQEGVYVQYKTPADTGWLTIHFFDPNGGADPTLINWRNWCFNVPAVALTSNTQFRFYQDNDSGADYDHWGIDNVAIYCNDANFAITWQHDGYNAGAAGGINPTPVAPRATTSYAVVMASGATTCYDTVTVFVRQPGLVMNAGADTILCVGTCVQLNASAKVVTSFAHTASFASTDTIQLTFFPPVVTPAVSSIDVFGLTIDTLHAGDIHSVCLAGIVTSLGNASIELISPNLDTIVLVPVGATTSMSYYNTCFTTGAADITTGTAPYTGDWAPAEAFTSLSGGPANGNWQLKITPSGSNLFGNFLGWSIAFNEPDISYAGIFNWQPAANMADSNTLSPTVCPETSTGYVLTLSDTSGCATATDTVFVTIDSCIGGLAAPFAGTGAAWYINPLLTGKTDNCNTVEATNATMANIPCSQVPGVGCLFVQNDTVYRICGNSQLFLYDYNAQAGDVWHVYDAPDTAAVFPGTAVTIHVVSADQVNIRGNNLRRIRTSITDAPFVNAGYVYGDVIEGIGSSYYFLPRRPQNLGDSVPFVSCFYSDLIGAVHFDNAGYTPVDSCVCQTILGADDLDGTAGGKLTFNAGQKTVNYFSGGVAKPIAIQIYNVVGQMLIAEEATGISHSISTAPLAAGVYVAVVIEGNKKRLTQKFVLTD
ncbi:MAG TPA: T9SS type A sorting domain-containing protein [Chitinophagales bacterium]|nr:T9SS type A sorting domain-containing protein [Chitinophagales bacterium]